MTEKRNNKPDIKGFLIKITVIAAALLALCLSNVYAEDRTIAVEWPDGVFDTGDEIVIEFAIYGLEKGHAYSGSINAEYKGLGFSIPEAAPGFNVKANLQPGSVTVTFETDGKFTPSSDGKAAILMIRAFITEAPETTLKAYAVISDGNMNEMTKTGIYTVKRKALPTQTPAANETPTPVTIPTEEPTLTPTPTLVVVNTPSPGAETETPEATGAPATEIPYNTAETVPSQKPGGSSGGSGDDTVKLGKIVFWTIVALVAGIWIGIAVGAVLWRKKRAIFVTDEEKKIIGKK